MRATMAAQMNHTLHSLAFALRGMPRDALMLIQTADGLRLLAFGAPGRKSRILQHARAIEPAAFFRCISLVQNSDRQSREKGASEGREEANRPA